MARELDPRKNIFGTGEEDPRNRSETGFAF